MSRVRLVLTATITGTFVLAGVAAMTARQASDDDDAAAAAVFTKTCVKCHTADRITGQRRTRAQWSEVEDTMVAKGAAASDDDLDTVLDYLVRRYGRVNVNKSAADDVRVVLHLSGHDADAVVAYRKANGPFADFEALAKVPGIDGDQLARMRDAIEF
jgi:competence ComEA-like helix-hairpin-helix protein